jgi:hypothetical protein
MFICALRIRQHGYDAVLVAIIQVRCTDQNKPQYDERKDAVWCAEIRHVEKEYLQTNYEKKSE